MVAEEMTDGPLFTITSVPPTKNCIFTLAGLGKMAGPSGTLVKLQGSLDLIWGTKGLLIRA
jgi:hypothetical protein